MQTHPDIATVPETEVPSEPTSGVSQPWHAEVRQLLGRAAELCVQHDLGVDDFMRGAWASYVESRPGMRDYLEEMQLRDQLDEIRKAGLMGQA